MAILSIYIYTHITYIFSCVTSTVRCTHLYYNVGNMRLIIMTHVFIILHNRNVTARKFEMDYKTLSLIRHKHNTVPGNNPLNGR